MNTSDYHVLDSKTVPAVGHTLIIITVYWWRSNFKSLKHFSRREREDSLNDIRRSIEINAKINHDVNKDRSEQSNRQKDDSESGQ